MAENHETRYHGIIETAKNAKRRNKSSYQIRRPSDRVVKRLQEAGFIIEDIEGEEGRIRVSFDPTLEIFKEVQDTP